LIGSEKMLSLLLNEFFLSLYKKVQIYVKNNKNKKKAQTKIRLLFILTNS
jgi:hypothetical protein